MSNPQKDYQAALIFFPSQMSGKDEDWLVYRTHSRRIAFVAAYFLNLYYDYETWAGTAEAILQGAAYTVSDLTSLDVNVTQNLSERAKLCPAQVDVIRYTWGVFFADDVKVPDPEFQYVCKQLKIPAHCQHSFDT